MGSSRHFGSPVWVLFPGSSPTRYHFCFSNFSPPLELVDPLYHKYAVISLHLYVLRSPLFSKIPTLSLLMYHFCCLFVVQLPSFPHGTFRSRSRPLSRLSRWYCFLPYSSPLLTYSRFASSPFSFTTTSFLSLVLFSRRYLDVSVPSPLLDSFTWFPFEVSEDSPPYSLLRFIQLSLPLLILLVLQLFAVSNASYPSRVLDFP